MFCCHNCAHSASCHRTSCHDTVLPAAHELVALADQDQRLRLVDEHQDRHAVNRRPQAVRLSEGLARTMSSRMSLALQSVAPGDYFEFDPDCVFDGNYRARLEYKRR